MRITACIQTMLHWRLPRTVGVLAMTVALGACGASSADHGAYEREVRAALQGIGAPSTSGAEGRCDDASANARAAKREVDSSLRALRKLAVPDDAKAAHKELVAGLEELSDLLGDTAKGGDALQSDAKRSAALLDRYTDPKTSPAARLAAAARLYRKAHYDRIMQPKSGAAAAQTCTQRRKKPSA